MGHRGIFYINVPHTHTQTYIQTDILHVPRASGLIKAYVPANNVTKEYNPDPTNVSEKSNPGLANATSVSYLDQIEKEEPAPVPDQIEKEDPVPDRRTSTSHEQAKQGG